MYLNLAEINWNIIIRIEMSVKNKRYNIGSQKGRNII